MSYTQKSSVAGKFYLCHIHDFVTSSFKQFLELEPLLRDTIIHFHQSKYASCLKMLNELHDTFMLDQYLANHVASIYTQIRNKALIQV